MGILRPHCPVHSVTALRKYGTADAPRTTTSDEKAFAVRAKLDIDVRRHTLRAGEEIRESKAACLTFASARDDLIRGKKKRRKSHHGKLDALDPC